MLPTYPELLAEARTRAEKGLAWIEETGRLHGLKSIEELDLDRLQISNCSRCVLGQLGRGYFSVLSKLFDAEFDNEAMKWAQEHGFCQISHQDVWGNILTEAWRQLIAERRVA